MVEPGAKVYTTRECRSSSQHPPLPVTKRQYAVRQYHGIRPGGELVPKSETPTQEELADELGVSRQTVNQWVNEPIPLVEGLSEFERWALFAMVMSGDEEKLEEYLTLRRLEERADSSIPVSGEEDAPEEAPVPEGFSW